MGTKSTGTTERQVKTVVTDQSSDSGNPTLEDGCSREDMYSHRYVSDGMRHSFTADNAVGKDMRKWK